MTSTTLVEILLAGGQRPSAKALIEASVHLPKRGRRWIATYRDGSGRQFWKSTGLTDRRAALIVAQKLEQDARRVRAEQGDLDKPFLRAPHGSGLTQEETAIFLGPRSSPQIVHRTAVEAAPGGEFSSLAWRL